MNKFVNGSLLICGCCFGLAVLFVEPTRATAANTSSVSRLERIVEYADIKSSGVYTVCYEGHEFLITSAYNHEITVTQVMEDGLYGLDPKRC